MRSDIPIDVVYAGEVSAVDAMAKHSVVGTLTNAATGRWEINLFPFDLEQYRDHDKAVIPIYATGGRCHKTALIGSIEIPLGPPTNVIVDKVTLAPKQSCSAAVDTRLLLTVTGEVGDRGGLVTLTATRGVFDNGNASITVPLLETEAETDAGAETESAPSATVGFKPTSEGTAIITAIAGAASDAATVVITGLPTVDPPARAQGRGQQSFITFKSTGEFERCTRDDTSAASATVTLVRRRGVTDPSLAFDVALAQSPDCSASDEILAAASFSADAPDGASVLVRCREANGRSATATLTVTPKPVSVVAVSKVTLTSNLSPGVCYVPADGFITPVITVRANDTASVGGEVTVHANHGKWADNSTDAEVELTPSSPPGSAEATLIFVPSTPGIATLVATSNGPASDPLQFTVAGPPTVAPSITAIVRNTSRVLEFVTAGKFERCVLETSGTGITATVLEQPNGNLSSGPVTVTRPGDCATPESVRVSVAVATATPATSTAVVRCYEQAYGRSISATVSVAP